MFNQYDVLVQFEEAKKRKEQASKMTEKKKQKKKLQKQRRTKERQEKQQQELVHQNNSEYMEMPAVSVPTVNPQIEQDNTVTTSQTANGYQKNGYVEMVNTQPTSTQKPLQTNQIGQSLKKKVALPPTPTTTVSESTVEPLSQHTTITPTTPTTSSKEVKRVSVKLEMQVKEKQVLVNPEMQVKEKQKSPPAQTTILTSPAVTPSQQQESVSSALSASADMLIANLCQQITILTTSLGQAMERISALENENTKIHYSLHQTQLVCQQLLQQQEYQKEQHNALYIDQQRLQSFVITQVVMKQQQSQPDPSQYYSYINQYPGIPPGVGESGKPMGSGIGEEKSNRSGEDPRAVKFYASEGGTYESGDDRGKSGETPFPDSTITDGSYGSHPPQARNQAKFLSSLLKGLIEDNEQTTSGGVPPKN